MAMKMELLLLGVDVAKATLEIALDAQEGVTRLVNERKAIRQWLEALPGPAALAVEATNVYHLELIEQAHRLGHTVYVVDGLRLHRYRQSVGVRAKTDAGDARLLLRYLRNERQDLRAWTPPPQGYREVQGLLRQRAALIQAKTSLGQSLRGTRELKATMAKLLRLMAQIERKLTDLLRRHLQQLGWYADARRCQGIEGIGPVTSFALTWIFRRGEFARSDAFIAFLGMDVRARDSGTFRGKRKLTKHGDPELRRLLYLAAMAASRSAAWKPFYERARQRGMASTQALVALARKLARIAFALLKNGTAYQPKAPLHS